MTNAEFLNENFGTNYKQWMKCGWYYDDKKEILVWMVNFNKTVSSGWQNSIVDENTITEVFVESLDNQLETHRTVLQPYRLAVDKSQGYKILGLYQYDALNSNERTFRVWKKIANSITEFYSKKN